MKKGITLIIFAFVFQSVSSQITHGFYRQYLPINTHAQISYLSPGSDLETILFDAEPVVRYHFYNNIAKKNLRVEPKGKAFYVSFRPHLRMYNSQSNPVRTPSYKIALGGQYSKLFHHSTTKAEQFSFSFESGHYSNGQPNCFLDPNILDGIPACDSLYLALANADDLSPLINRESGNFSTNWTEVIFQYKWIRADEENYMENKSHTLRLGYTLYHDKFLFLANFGGYSDNDIKLYGRHFINGLYEYSSSLNLFGKSTDFLFNQSLDYVTNADSRVPSLRSVTKFVIFPFPSDLGVFASFIKGRDNYNIRFVDNVTQFQIGLTWTGKMKLSLDMD
ncbi:MAG: hypothetical protein P1U56_07415 [Saprospiraceae bacterium]|nr:hypothetical protein [Saprospiraceae bacterium]